MRLLFHCAAAGAIFLSPAPVRAAPAEVPTPQAVVDELLAADRAFARSSEKAELVEGLSAMFDADTVMPAPGGFVRGKDAIVAALKSNPANAGSRAAWTPVRGGIAADGKHGFTIGFMTITADGKPSRKAKYISYWIKRPAGWKVAVYKRVPQPDGEFSTALMAPSLPARELAPATDSQTLAAWKSSLDQAERSFSDESRVIGLGPAFVKYGSPDATNIGAGAGFTVGNTAIGADVAAFNGPPIKWEPDDVIVSTTGDLGITWGYIRPLEPAKNGQPSGGPYTTIWRRAGPDQPWRYIAE